MKRLLLLPFCGLITAAVVGQTSSYVPDPKWTAPPRFATKSNPLEGNTGAVAGGRKLFQRHCAECHGEGAGGGKKKNAPSLALDSIQRQTDGTLFWKVSNGKTDGDMPDFSRLTELQRWQLVLYIREMRSPMSVHGGL